MNTIAFRVWDKYKQKFFFSTGEFWFDDALHLVSFDLNDLMGDHDDDMRFEFNLSSTLKDAGGHVLYDMDIVKYAGRNLLVKFDRGSFLLWETDKTRGLGYTLGRINKKVKVAGTLYTTPQLLKANRRNETI